MAQEAGHRSLVTCHLSRFTSLSSDLPAHAGFAIFDYQPDGWPKHVGPSLIARLVYMTAKCPSGEFEIELIGGFGTVLRSEGSAAAHYPSVRRSRTHRRRLPSRSRSCNRNRRSSP